MKDNEINEIVKKRVLDSGKFPIAKLVIVNNEELRDKLTLKRCCNNKNPDLLIINWYFESSTVISIYVNGTKFRHPIKIERTWYFNRNYESFRLLLDYLIELEQFRDFLNNKNSERSDVYSHIKRLREVLI